MKQKTLISIIYFMNFIPEKSKKSMKKSRDGYILTCVSSTKELVVVVIHRIWKTKSPH